MTIRESSRNLDGHWNAVLRDVGERRARVWRLYIAISALRPEWGAGERRAVRGAELRPERLTV